MLEPQGQGICRSGLPRPDRCNSNLARHQMQRCPAEAAQVGRPAQGFAEPVRQLLGPQAAALGIDGRR